MDSQNMESFFKNLPIEISAIINEYAVEKNPLLIKELNNIKYVSGQKPYKLRCLICSNTYKNSFIYHERSWYIHFVRSHPICLACHNPKMEDLMEELEWECEQIGIEWAKNDSDHELCTYCLKEINYDNDDSSVYVENLPYHDGCYDYRFNGLGRSDDESDESDEDGIVSDSSDISDSDSDSDN